MTKKTNNLDYISYFIKFFVFIFIGIISIISIINLIDLFELVFSKLEIKLCNYISIFKNNNIVSDFLLMHYPDTFGAGSYNFMDESTSILSITLFLKIFEIFKYFYLIIIGILLFILFNRYSKNKIDNITNTKIITSISIMLILIPFFYYARDYFGCMIIDSLVEIENKILFSDFKIYYLFLGLLLLLINFKDEINTSKKSTKIILVLIFIPIIILLTFSSILNIITFINLLSIKEESFTYIELIKAKNPFISQLVLNNFKIFGDCWTYLGPHTDLKSAMYIHYISRSLIPLILPIIFIIIFIKSIKKKYINYKLLPISITVISVLLFIIDLIINIVIIYQYNHGEYTANVNLKYSLFNFNYLYLILFSLSTYIISFKNVENTL